MFIPSVVAHTIDVPQEIREETRTGKTMEEENMWKYFLKITSIIRENNLHARTKGNHISYLKNNNTDDGSNKIRIKLHLRMSLQLRRIC